MDREYFLNIGREVGRQIVDAIKSPPDGHEFYGNQHTGGSGGTALTSNAADKDFQGRDQSNRTAILGGNVTSDEANILEAVGKNALGRVHSDTVDKAALDTFKKNGLIRYLPKVFQSSPSTFELTGKGNELRSQYFRVKERISRG